MTQSAVCLRGRAGGYGFCHVPTTPGVHNVDCSTWRPQVHRCLAGQCIALCAPALNQLLGALPRLSTEQTLMRNTVCRWRHLTTSFRSQGSINSRGAIVCIQTGAHVSKCRGVSSGLFGDRRGTLRPVHVLHSHTQHNRGDAPVRRCMQLLPEQYKAQRIVARVLLMTWRPALETAADCR